MARLPPDQTSPAVGNLFGFVSVMCLVIPWGLAFLHLLWWCARQMFPHLPVWRW
jgi:hypothetical protein